MLHYDPSRQHLRRRLLRRGLAELGLSERQAAQLLGYEPAYLHAVLVGRCPFTEGFCFRLQAAFGLPFLALEPPPDIALAPDAQAALGAAVATWRPAPRAR